MSIISERHIRNVIPGPVTASSIRCTGLPTNVTVVWDPVTTLENISITYDVTVRMGDRELSMSSHIATELTLPWHDLEAWHPVIVSVQALTRWGQSLVSEAAPYTPPSLPGQPTNLRHFMTRLHASDVERLLIRWSAPNQPGGEIDHYRIQFCEAAKCTINTTARTSWLISLTLVRSHTHVLVTAHNQVGYGNYSLHTLNRSVDACHPVIPKLAVVLNDAIVTIDLDDKSQRFLIDLNSTTTKQPPLAVFLARNEIYSVLEDNKIVAIDLSTGNYKKLLSLPHSGEVHMTVDWIAQNLYWVQEKFTNDRYLPEKIDAGNLNKHPSIFSHIGSLVRDFHDERFVKPAPRSHQDTFLPIKSFNINIIDLNYGTKKVFDIFKTSGTIDGILSVPWEREIIYITVREADGHFRLYHKKGSSRFEPVEKSDSNCLHNFDGSLVVASNNMYVGGLTAVMNRIDDSKNISTCVPVPEVRGCDSVAVDSRGIYCSHSSFSSDDVPSNEDGLINSNNYISDGVFSTGISSRHATSNHILKWFCNKKCSDNIDLCGSVKIGSVPESLVVLDSDSQPKPGKPLNHSKSN